MYRVGTNTFIVATRKHHSCEWCGGLINAGRNAMKRDYRWDDQWVHVWQHINCFEAMESLAPDEFTPGEFKRGSTKQRYE